MAPIKRMPTLPEQNSLSMNDNQTDKLVRKMTSYLRTMNKKSRKVRKSSFWGLSSDQSSGEVVELEMEHIKLRSRDTNYSQGDDNKNKQETTNNKGNNTTSLFLENKCILNPNSLYRQSWDLIFVLGSLMYTALRVPYAIAFDIDEFKSADIWFVLNRFIDLIFIMDMIFIFFTAKKDGRRIITSFKSIALDYLKGWFLFDLAASIPLDLVLWIISGAKFGEFDGVSASRSAKLIRVIKIFRTFRILRLLRLKRIVITLEIFLGLHFSVMAIAKFTISIGLLAHLIACGFLSIGEHNGWLTNIAGYDEGGKYIASLYWAFTTM